jgi:putative ABC transport system permease protein
MISIPASLRLASSSLSGRRAHTILIVAAVSLAASLFAAISVLIGTVHGNVELQLNRMLGATQVRLFHRFSGRFDADMLETVRGWPEVDYAMGLLSAPMTLVHKDMRRDAETGRLLRVTPTAIGMDVATDPQFTSLEMRSGRRPEAPNEILIDPLTASALQADIGDHVRVQRFGAPIDLIVVGIYERRLIGTLQRPQIRVDAHTVAQSINKPAELTQVSIILREGEDVQDFVARHAHEIQEPLVLEPGELVRAGFDRRMRIARLSFVLVATLGLLSCSFIVVTGLTTAVVERQRELAVLRCIGASHRQLFTAQIMIGIFIGALGGLNGIPLGAGLAWIVLSQFTDLLPAGIMFELSGLSLVFAGCIGAGLVGASYPAWLASRVAPLKAMAMRGRPTSRRALVVCTTVGLALVATQLALLLITDPSARFWGYVTVGLPLLLVGYFLLAVPVMLLIAPIVGPAISGLLRLPKGMLVGSVRATPFRNGLTAGALMVGMALLVSSWSEGRALLDQWVGKMRFADGFVYRAVGMTQEQQRAITALPFVERSCPIGYLALRVVGEQFMGVRGIDAPVVTCIGFDSETFFDMNSVDWLAGDREVGAKLLRQGQGILVADRFLTRGYNIGDMLTLGSGKAQHEFEIVGVVSSAGLEVATSLFGLRDAYMEHALSSVFMEFETVERLYDNHDAHMLQLDLAEDITDDEAEAAIIDASPGVLFRSGRSIRDMLGDIATTAFAVTTAAAALELFIACFGVGNIIMANIHARRFEYGVLRAVGAGRGLLLRLILGEAAMIALVGAVVGTGMGMHGAFVGMLHYRSLAGLDVHASFPAGPAALGTLIVLALSLLAALPAAVVLMLRRPTFLLATGRAA